MLYFEFNRRGGKEKYIRMTEEAFKAALQQENRYFIRYGEDYILESTEQDFRKFCREKNHSEYVQKNADSRKVIPLSLDTDEIEYYDITSYEKSVFYDGDNSAIDEQVLSAIDTAEKNKLLHQAIELLSPEEKYIITEIFFKNRTQSEIAKEAGIARATVNEKYHKILFILKKHLR